jgi:hypothetical protein
LNQTVSYAIICALSIVSLLASLHGIRPFVSDIEGRIEVGCALSVLGTISNLMNSVVGGGSVEGIVFTPLQVKLSAGDSIVSAICGDFKTKLEFPFEVSPLNTSVKGLVRIRAVWLEEKVSLVIEG